MAAKYWHRLAHESELWQKGLTFVAGVDEAGCGPLAGPVFAAAVVFPWAWAQTGLMTTLRGLNDSKKWTVEGGGKFSLSSPTDPVMRYPAPRGAVASLDKTHVVRAA